MEALEKKISNSGKITLTALGGLVAGYLIQQNKGTLDQIPSGQSVAAVLANLGFYVVKDLSFVATTSSHTGSQRNIETDIKYLGIFNASGVVGYLVGNLKDLIS